MEHGEQSSSKSCSVSTVDAVTAAVLMALGALVMFDTYRIGASWEPLVGPQAGYFPFRIGVLIFICSAATLYQATLSKKRDRSMFVDWDSFKRVLQVLVPSMIYVLGVQFIGIYIASAIFIGGFMLWLGKFRLLSTILISIGVPAVLFWTFEVQFLIPLPKGPVEAMFGY
ncbi:MAG: tripartite tricarboxylate transporter TctB family protein [Pseudomonadota bacterium]